MDATEKITKNLGGNRLGSGDKNNISMHAYNRSTHDLSRAWRSSMNVGTLVPFMSEIALNGDTWTIDLESLVRTIPTIRPLYGSYKLQLDVFSCPMRLYNGLLHNNMVNIGLNMQGVKIPKMVLQHRIYNPLNYTFDPNNSQISSNALLNYLGVKGISDLVAKPEISYVDVERKFNAIPVLAYYDIYKNYYANKQENKGVIISGQDIETTGTLNKIRCSGAFSTNVLEWEYETPADSTLPTGVTTTGDTYQQLQSNGLTDPNIVQWQSWEMDIPTNQEIAGMEIVIQKLQIGTQVALFLAVPLSTIFPNYAVQGEIIYLGEADSSYHSDNTYEYKILGTAYNATQNFETAIGLTNFDLSNIDKARIMILRDTGINNEFTINSLNISPYKDICDTDTNGKTLSARSQQGLAIKTYQSDLFNNWLKTEWIDGSNGINQITAIDVSSGTFTIDALNLAKKVYNMLNRIAVSGGTYEDWQEAVYSTKAVRRAETPVYEGGMSAEIVFEEVVSTAKTEEDPLGTLAGKGVTTNKRGGRIEIKTDEPSYIIGIVSITPRVDYSQGNKWDMTELDTINDLHKPELDGIGFEDLLQERMAYFGTYWDETNQKFEKMAAGKVPAWINYMTAVNETHGEFAEELKAMDMTLNRRYEYRTTNNPHDVRTTYGIKDLTTYIDPTKYNYNFADTTLEAQNFWVQIGAKVICRRVMSAKVIPYL